MKPEFAKETSGPKGEVWHKLEEALAQYKKSMSESEKKTLEEKIKKLASEVVSTAEVSDESLIKNLEEQLKDLGIE